MTGLTLKILDEAIKQLEKTIPPIIGFKVNPSDLRGIKEKVKHIWCVDKGVLTMTPPYAGHQLYPDANIPEGMVEPIYRR